MLKNHLSQGFQWEIKAASMIPEPEDMLHDPSGDCFGRGDSHLKRGTSKKFNLESPTC